MPNEPMLASTRSRDFGPVVGTIGEKPWTGVRDPQSLEEQRDLYAQHCYRTGDGADTRQHLACPVCCAPDFLVAPIANKGVQRAMQQGVTCLHCARSFKVLFGFDATGGQKIEVVQTGGDDPPAWLEPKLRRVPVLVK